jgi:FkbH-like protein
MNQNLNIVVLSNFVALELRDSLAIWLDDINIKSMTTYYQSGFIVQPLLCPDDRLVNADLVLILLNLNKWKNGIKSADNLCGDALRYFIDAIRHFASANSGKQILILSCLGTQREEHLRDSVLNEGKLCEALGDVGQIKIITTADLNRIFPIDDQMLYLDPYSIDPHDLPYSSLYFSTLGALVARHALVRFRKPRKVIAVDCDNTLWSGLCGELGPRGVTIGSGNFFLQKQLAQQAERGQLICLCSKNNEKDVRAVFSENEHMYLRWEQIAAYRINWSSKAENLISISQELNIGPECFIFLDDTPSECGEVEMLIPSVLTAQVPQQQSKFEQELQHIWELDSFASTYEDARRSAFYQEEHGRDAAKLTAPNLESFLLDLQLIVRIDQLVDQDIARVQQMFYRVTQFNLNCKALHSIDLRRLILTKMAYTVKAADRYGDYGTVGFINLYAAGESLHVSHWLLSCRALGRGVEEKIMTHILGIANGLHLKQIHFELTETARNAPIRAFLSGPGRNMTVSIGYTVDLS